MDRSRRTEIERHLPEAEIDELLRETEDDRRLRRIGFVKNLYRGDTISEAAGREGRSPATGTRWARAWNEGGFDELMPNFGGGRPPKLDEDERDELVELLRDDQPWKSEAVRRLLKEEFDVEYHPNYLGTFLRNLGLSYVDSSTARPHQPETVGERVGSGRSSNERRSESGGWVVDEDDPTDS